MDNGLLLSCSHKLSDAVSDKLSGLRVDSTKSQRSVFENLCVLCGNWLACGGNCLRPQAAWPRTAGSIGWAGATQDSLWPRNRVQKWGRSSPTRCFAHVQIDRHGMCILLSLGHLLDRQGDRDGDGYGDLCLSCTRHLPAVLRAMDALQYSFIPLLIKRL